jgi:rare lipoprotein A
MAMNWQKLMVVGVFAAALAGCAGTGGYQDGAPGSREASEFVNAPDAVPVDEAIVPVSTRPYTVFGRRYQPLKQRKPLVQEGVASWYGKQFHGRPTSIGETYDMYAMTAAHPTLPLPSYVRVTNKENQRSVVVRVNDRGPFLNERIVDLSFAAAAKIGYTEQGVANVTLEVVDPLVVTLQAVRKRVGLEPISDEAVSDVSGAKTDEAAEPLLAAATLPLTTAEPEAAASDAAESPSTDGLPTTAQPEPVNAEQAEALPPIAQTEPLPPEQTALAPTADPENSQSLSSTQAEPQSVSTAPAQAAVPETVEELDLGTRTNRRIADVMIPPDVQVTNAPAQFTTPPVITVEAFEGKGLRRAIPESERARRERARKARNTLAARKRDSKDEPVFVVPYKDQLPKKAKEEQKPPKVYLQLGSYDTEKSARLAFVRATTSLTWMRQPVQVINDRGLHKVQAGPFASARTARKAAKRIRLGTKFSPFYVFR